LNTLDSALLTIVRVYKLYLLTYLLTLDYYIYTNCVYCVDFRVTNVGFFSVYFLSGNLSMFKSAFSFLRQLTTWHCPQSAAAERRPCSNQSISPVIRAHSNKPAIAACCGRMGQTGQTDKRKNRWTDGWTPDSYIDPAPHTMRVVPKTPVATLFQVTRLAIAYGSRNAGTIIDSVETLAYVNSCVNFIVYSLMWRPFRLSLVEVRQCCLISFFAIK